MLVPVVQMDSYPFLLSALPSCSLAELNQHFSLTLSLWTRSLRFLMYFYDSERPRSVRVFWLVSELISLYDPRYHITHQLSLDCIIMRGPLYSKRHHGPRGRCALRS